MTALLKITQASHTDTAGRAVKGTLTDGTVVFSNGSNTNVSSWKYEVLNVPPGSAIPLAVQGPGGTATYTMGQPDVPGSYRVRLTVIHTDLSTDVDIRNLIVPFPNGLMCPPYQGIPLPLSPVLKPDEMNVGGQAWGWHGDADPTRPLMWQIIKSLDTQMGKPSMGWHTVIDVDFTSLTNQALHTDGIVTLSDGSLWTKHGSALDGTTNPWAIVNGSGLRTSCASGGYGNGFAYNTGGMAYPTLCPNVLLGTLSGQGSPRVRATIILGTHSDTSGSDFGGVGLSIEARNASSRTATQAFKIVDATTTFLKTKIRRVYDDGSTDDYTDNTRNPNNNILVLDLPGGLLAGPVLAWFGNTGSNVLPANFGTDMELVGCTNFGHNYAQVTNPAAFQANNWLCQILNAMGETTSVCWIKRYKLEAFY